MRRHPIRRVSANRGRRTSARRRKRKASLRLCDAVFSKLVRSLGHCEAWAITHPATDRAGDLRCSGPLQCAHIVSRRYRATRWLRENAMCLCAAHHTYWTFRPIEWERFVLDSIGPDAYDDLKRKALAVTRVDYSEVLERLTEAARG